MTTTNSAATVTDHRPWRLILTRPVWETAWRTLLFDSRAWASGSLTSNDTPDIRELLADRVVINHESPSGQSRPPLDDWFVLGVLDRGQTISHATVVDRARRFSPGQFQILVAVYVDSRDRRLWDGVVMRNGRSERLAEIRVVGSGMLRISRSPDDVSRSDELSLSRWSRTRGAIGADVHDRVRQSTVTLIGGGRNGSEMASMLAAVGVERLRIIEPDELGLHNLDAMRFVTPSEVGQPKGQALAKYLRDFRPDMGLTVFDRSIADVGSAELLRQRSDLLVTCVDNETARLAVSLAAQHTLTAHLDVGTSIQRTPEGEISITGDARLLLPRQGCIACVGGLEDLEEALYDLNAPPGSLRRRPQLAWHEQRAGSLITINSMTVGVALQMWLDMVAGRLRSSYWQRLAWTPDEGLIAHAGPVGAADDCRFCQR